MSSVPFIEFLPVAVLATVIVGLAIGLALVAGRLRASQRRADQMGDLMERSWQILASAREGLLFWDVDGGATYCSRTLAEALGERSGRLSSFEDLAARFGGADRQRLQARAAALRGQGADFDLTLHTTAGHSCRVHGTRVFGQSSRPLADVLWVAPAAPAGGGAETGEAEAARDRDRLFEVLDALPVPVWLRNSAHDVVFTNRACRREQVAPLDKELAQKARTQGLSVSETRIDARDRNRLTDITETPLPAGLDGTVGFALERPGEAPGSARSERPAPPAPPASRPAEGWPRDALESLPVGVAIVDRDGRLTYANPAYARLWELEGTWLAGGPRIEEILDRLEAAGRMPVGRAPEAYRRDVLSRIGTLTGRVETMLWLPNRTTLRVVAQPMAGQATLFTYQDVPSTRNAVAEASALAPALRQGAGVPPVAARGANLPDVLPRCVLDGRLSDMSRQLQKSLSGLRGQLLTQVESGEEVRTVFVTSALSGEGKTTTAINLALALARSTSGPVLLMEGNFHAPTFKKLFGLDDGPGLAEVVSDGIDPMRGLRRTDRENLFILPAGRNGELEGSVFESALYEAILSRLAAEFEFVVMDGPPFLNSPEAQLAQRAFDGVVQVVACERTKMGVANAVKERVENDGGRVLGVVLNRRKFYIPRIFYGRF